MKQLTEEQIKQLENIKKDINEQNEQLSTMLEGAKMVYNGIEDELEDEFDMPKKVREMVDKLDKVTIVLSQLERFYCVNKAGSVDFSYGVKDFYDLVQVVTCLLTEVTLALGKVKLEEKKEEQISKNIQKSCKDIIWTFAEYFEEN